MENQSKFLEMLQEITQIAHAQQDKLTKEEVKKYLGDQRLSEEKMQAVYYYLGENHITVEGYDFVPDKREEVSESLESKRETEGKANVSEIEQTVKKDAQALKAAKQSTPEKKETRREANMKLYQQELALLSGDLEKEEELILAFLRGDISLKNTIIEKYLQKVVELAKKYEKRSVQLDEVIAEGNVGLMMAMQIIQENCADYILPEGKLDAEKFFGTLKLEVVHAMESYIDDIETAKDWENTVLAKTNLLHEAAKYMTEEMGRVPTIEELSEYTKISREEIKEIMGLSEDAKRVAKPE